MEDDGDIFELIAEENKYDDKWREEQENARSFKIYNK